MQCQPSIMDDIIKAIAVAQGCRGVQTGEWLGTDAALACKDAMNHLGEALILVKLDVGACVVVLLDQGLHLYLSILPFAEDIVAHRIAGSRSFLVKFFQKRYAIIAFTARNKLFLLLF